MDSHEVMREAFKEKGVKAVAAAMNLSTSLLYKWCEPKDSPDAAGADNPLDRLAKIFEVTGDRAPVAWLCRQADGFFVRNPSPNVRSKIDLLRVTQGILKEFTELLDAVSKSFEDDGNIDANEAKRIRSEWEDLKTAMESFVVACEQGTYGKAAEAQ